MDDRKLTFIVVPHGDLETKTFEISYRKLALFGWVAVAVAVLFMFLVALWFSVAAKAARVGTLERELERFEQQRAQVDSLNRLLMDVEAQYERVRQLLGADAPVEGQAATLPALQPTAGASDGPVVDAWPLGTVKGYITREQTADTNHPGLDIAVAPSTQIRAAGPGTVIEAGEDSIYGKFIRIDHGGGIESLYGHASQLLIRKGAEVKRLQIIALSGNTGRSTAPHLHFEIRERGVPVDPRRFVRQP